MHPSKWLLRPGAVTPFFRPIVDVLDPEGPLAGLACSARGPAGSPAEHPAALLQLARTEHVEFELDYATTACALAAIVGLPELPKVVLPVHGCTLARGGFTQFLDTELQRRQLDPSAVVVDVAEPAMYDSVPLQHAREELRAAGVQVWFDVDSRILSGDPLSMLRYEPDCLGLGGRYLRSVNRRGLQEVLLDAVQTVAKQAGACMSIHGMETLQELALVARHGFELARGPLFGELGTRYRVAAATAQ